MKHFYIIFAFFIVSITANSQSFVDTTKLWNVVECYSGPFGSDCITMSYKLQGDTSIGLNSYKLFYQTSDTTLNNWFLRGAMRDSGQRVFFTDFVYEYLLYHFGANVGDTIEPINFCAENYLIVDSVDTVLINGQPKRRMLFNFQNCTYREEWIEDIGSIHGPVNEFLLNGVFVFDLGLDLLCYWKNDTVQWINPTYNDCYFVLTGINEPINTVSLSISPNPINDYAIIQLKGTYSNWNWALYNSIGLKVQNIENIKEPQLRIYRDNLSAGVYLFQVRNEKGILSTGRLIIQ